MRTPLIAFAMVLAAGPALAQRYYAQDDTIAGAVTQPLNDLGVVRKTAPPALREAAQDPYDRIDTNNCPAMFAEIKELDSLLGPDLDDPTSAKTNGSLVTDAVRGVVKLPFASVVRRLTGAQKREQERQRAITAGIARRAYLKGAITQCDKPPPAPEVVAEPPAPAAQAETGAAVDALVVAPDPSALPANKDALPAPAELKTPPEPDTTLPPLLRTEGS